MQVAEVRVVAHAQPIAQNKMSDILYKIASYLAFLPILIAIYRYKYLNKTLWWYVAGLLTLNICGIISIKLSEQHINNHFMMYINACSNIILRTFFFESFIISKTYKKTLFFTLIAFLIGVCADIFVHGIYMNQYLFMIIDVWAIYFFLVCLNQILKDDSIESLRDFPLFWIVIGTLFFVIFDFFLSVSNGWLYAVNREFFFMLWDYITPIFMFIRIVFVCIGYWKTKKYEQNFGKIS